MHLNRLKERVERVLSGERKKEVCDEWLRYIREETDKFMREEGVRREVLPFDYTEEPPKDFDQVKFVFCFFLFYVVFYFILFYFILSIFGIIIRIHELTIQKQTKQQKKPYHRTQPPHRFRRPNRAIFRKNNNKSVYSFRCSFL